MILIRSTFLKQLKCIDSTSHSMSVGQLKMVVSKRFGVPQNIFDVYSAKCKLQLDSVLQDGCTVYLLLAVPGGKGGFGSMLRAIGAQIEKTTNREACRDLSGRRLRDINEEQRLKTWLAKKVEREEAAAQRRKDRLQRLKEPTKHNFHDPEYNKERSELPDRVEDALSVGLKKKAGGPSTSKRTGDVDNQGEPLKKKSHLWLGVDVSSDSEATSDEEQGSNLEEIQQSDNAVDANYPDTSSSNQSNFTTENDLSRPSSSSPSIDEPIPLEISEKKDDGKIDVNDNSVELVVEQNVTKDNMAEQMENVDLLSFNCVNELEELGLDRLKIVLVNLGLKCGGTLLERAQRLWSVRGLTYEEYPQAVKAKQSKQK